MVGLFGVSGGAVGWVVDCLDPAPSNAELPEFSGSEDLLILTDKATPATVPSIEAARKKGSRSKTPPCWRPISYDLPSKRLTIAPPSMSIIVIDEKSPVMVSFPGW